ncbi:MAG: hypothetical protein Q7T80_12910, partial [Methanoregula sp.]|nr:hypothetical protein [Methanoregula sp.]
MGHAADLSPATVNPTTIHGGFGPSPMPRLNLSCLEQQGVTRADVKAALDRNDTVLVRAWRDACGQSPDGISRNVSYRQLQNFRNGITPAGRNGIKDFPARNWSGQNNITEMAPGFYGGNISHRFPEGNSTLFCKGLLPNGSTLYPALNGSGMGWKNGAHPDGNQTAKKQSPLQTPRSDLREMSRGPHSGSAYAVNGTC